MTMPHDLHDYLAPGICVNSDHPDICSLAGRLTTGEASDIDRAVALYYWVRDEVRYNPYSVCDRLEDYRASYTLQAMQGWCVPKAILLAALCRAAGIPARLGFADVRNHLSTARMREMMQTDVFYFHGYTAIHLGGQWVKATPAFNVELCDRFGLKPLEFNGLEDSIYHAFDRAGNRHMEYINDRGQHLDLPFEEMMTLFHDHYPRMMALLSERQSDADQWMSEVEKETS